MKVLMINSVCGIRSTGRICTDLAVALEAEGHEVKIAYGRENVPGQFHKYAVRIGTDFGVKLHGVKARLMDADGLGSRHATKKFVKWIEAYDPDIIHLHNLHGYYINVPVLFKYIILHKKKVVWTLHDCWTFTGHSGTCDIVKCEKWLSGCGKCPLSKGYPKSYIDRSKRNLKWKKQLFSLVGDITIVTPSNWLAGLVKRSFFKDKAVEVIPNGIDITQFMPFKNDFRKVYGIEDKILLLGCASAWGKEKGLNDFITLSQRLDNRFVIVLVGLTKEQISDIPQDIICIERTQSVKELNQIYSSADLFLNLTYVDVYSMVNREALLSGTPVLTYDTGGCAECINEHNGISFKTGDLEGVLEFLVKFFKTDMFDLLPGNINDPISREVATQKYEKIIAREVL